MLPSTSIALKICGITKADQALKIASMGVNAIGLIGVKSSARYVHEKKRREIFNLLEHNFRNIERVWVVANLEAAEIEKGLVGIGSPSAVQLHGNESLEYCQKMKNKHPKICWWKAFRIREESDLLEVSKYEKTVDVLLLDAWSDSALGGTGKKIPLNLLSATNFQIPWWVAGGISGESVGEILSKTKPYGIDASSKLEISPGTKNIEKVAFLIESIKKIYKNNNRSTG
tara:strand:+ start:41 stop:727 length:687 start_codon:yes stop_codon:yes gene_type:complete